MRTNKTGAVLVMVAVTLGLMVAQATAAFTVPSDVRSIFTDHCVACHGGKSPSAGVSYQTDADLQKLVGEKATEDPKYDMIDPGKPDQSYIVMKIKGASGIVGQRMPLTGGYLSNTQTKTIESWIAGMSTSSTSTSGDPAKTTQESSSSMKQSSSSGGSKDPGSSFKELADQMYDGAYIFHLRCSGCHGKSGEGVTLFGPPLLKDPFVTLNPDDKIKEVILHGRKYENMHYPAYSGMPQWQFIRGGELQALVNYLKGPLQGE
jgi:mono/diheme cytochrome c family protein